MKREIKFRGLTDEGKWVYGLPIEHEYGISITNNFSLHHVDGAEWNFSDVRVVDETVGQYTGLKDENGTEIYEGDLINIGATEFGFITNNKGENVTYEVRFEGCDYILYREDIKMNWGRFSRLDEMSWRCQVVGNIHQNPELL